MIYILHGQDLSASYSHLQFLLNKYPNHNKVNFYPENSFEQFQNAILGQNLFNENELWAQEQLYKLSLEEKIAQFFMVASWPNRDEAHQLEIENLVKNQKIGGIIYFQGTKEQLQKSIQRMQAVSSTPLLIGIDAEWGLGMRVTDAERFPYAYTIGAANDPALSEEIGAMIAQECREIGIGINFAPVADVNSNPTNPVIGFRSFGQSPERVSTLVAATVKGMEKNGVGL